MREFVVLVSGAAAASNGDGEVLLSPGAHFGERGLIDDTPHECSVSTRAPTRLLVFGPAAFRGMLDRIPSVGRKLLSEMVTELRTIDQESRSLRAVS